MNSVSLLFAVLCDNQDIMFPETGASAEQTLPSYSLQAGQPKGLSSSPGRGEIFLFSVFSEAILGPSQLPIHQVLSAYSLAVKWTRHEPPSSAVQPLPPYAFMVYRLIKVKVKNKAIAVTGHGGL
jgi:hypothetical protein